MQIRRGLRSRCEPSATNRGGITGLGYQLDGRCRPRGREKQDERTECCNGFCSKHDPGNKNKVWVCWLMVYSIAYCRVVHIGNIGNIGNINNKVADIIGSTSCQIFQNPRRYSRYISLFLEPWPERA